MHYTDTVTATFMERPNRFIAKVQINGKIETVHVKNTGRCKEILIPGTKVVLEHSSNPDRKTAYDLIAAYKGDMLINIDSQSPNAAFKEFITASDIFGDAPVIYPEHVHGNSRFDFYVETGERKCFIEVKGVTLENDGICMFPDAPTERGVKHIRGLMKAVDEGYECYIALIVQMKGCVSFTPNYTTHEEFGIELQKAYEKGVNILVYDCNVTEDTMTVDGKMPFFFRK